MSSALCTVNTLSTSAGINLAGGASIHIALADLSGVNKWTIQCIGTDERFSASAITGGLTIDHVGKTANTSMASDDGNGAAWIFQSQVNDGVDLSGVKQPGLTANFAVYMLSSNGLRMSAVNETVEGDATFGWVAKTNAAARLASASPAVSTGAHLPVVVATAAALPTNTYNNGAGTLTATGNGALTIDGVVVTSGRVLTKDEAAGAHNGIYTVTQPGDGSHPYILTRAADANTSGLMLPGMSVVVQSGATSAGRTMVLVTPAPITLGTTPLRFVPQQSEILFDLFGGVGDGDLSGNGTDNSAALAAALLALAPGGTLRFGPHIYALNTTVTLAQSNVTLEGHAGATVLIAKNGSSYDWILARNAAGSGLKLIGLTFDANGTNRGASASYGCLRLVGPQTDMIIDSCTWRNTLGVAGEAVGAQFVTQRAQIVNCKALDCGSTQYPSDGTYVNGDHITVTNYIAQRIHDTGIVFQDASHVTLSNFSILDAQAGVAIGPSGNVDQAAIVISNGVIGCTIGATAQGAKAITAATAATPIAITSAAHGLVTGNRVYISGVKGVPEANGIRIAVVSDANHYTITDITGGAIAGSGSYVSGGYGQPAWQGVGIDFGTYGSSSATGELNGIQIENVIIDNRTNIGTPALAMYGNNASAPPPATAITGATNASPLVVSTIPAHGYSNGQIVCNYGVLGNKAANGRFKVANVTSNTFELNDLNGNKVAGSGAFVAPVATTTIASGSNGATLPQATINVAATTGFPTSGTMFVSTSTGVFAVVYSGVTGTSFTGCTGGGGIMSTGGLVSTDMGAYTQSSARTRNVKLKNVRIVDENIYSYCAYFVNVDNLEVEGCDFEGDSNPLVQIDARCTNVRFRRNLLKPSAAFGVQLVGGSHRVQFEENTIHGKDGVTSYGIVLADLSKEIYIRNNLVSGSILATTNGIFTNLCKINLDNQGWFGGKVGAGQAPSAAGVAITSPGSNTLAISMLGGGGAVGAGFGANGEYGGLSHDIPTLSGVVRMGASARGELGLTSGSYPWTFTPAAYFRLNLDSVGAFGIGAGGDPSASHTLMLLSGGTTAYSPMQFTPGAIKTSPVSGDVEMNSTNFFFTVGGVRYDVQKTYGNGVVGVNIPATALTLGGAPATNTVTVAGAAVGDLCVCTAASAPDAGVVWDAYVSSANTVTVRVQAMKNFTTTSTNYNVRVIKQ